MFVLQAACGCSTGRVRSNNEDNFYFDGKYLESVNNGQDGLLKIVKPLDKPVSLIVFDGMGGENFGEDASYTAAHEMEAIENEFHGSYASENGLIYVAERINNAVVKAARALNTNRMGSTMAGLVFNGEDVLVTNLGDSRIYRLRGTELTQLSVDHVVEMPGRKKAPLSQHLGIDPEDMTIEPYVARHSLDAGDWFLVCSDGVTDMLKDEQIAALIGQSANAADGVARIIGAALEAGGRDNTTAIVARVGKERAEEAPIQPKAEEVRPVQPAPAPQQANVYAKQPVPQQRVPQNTTYAAQPVNANAYQKGSSPEKGRSKGPIIAIIIAAVVVVGILIAVLAIKLLGRNEKVDYGGSDDAAQMQMQEGFITFGSYDGQPLNWFILDETNDGQRLLALQNFTVDRDAEAASSDPEHAEELLEEFMTDMEEHAFSDEEWERVPDHELGIFILDADSVMVYFEGEEQFATIMDVEDGKFCDVFAVWITVD